VSDPAKPVRVNRPFWWSAIGVRVVGNLANLVTTSQTFAILDVSDPVNPRPLVHYGEGFDDAWGVGAIDVVGDTAYFAAGRQGLLILDVAIPSSTPLLHIQQTTGSPSLEISGRIGATYVVEHTASLTNWKLFTTLTLTNSLQTIMQATREGTSQQFYRARRVP
jgi:hypothetical protein